MRDASRYDPARASLTTYLYGSARHHTRRGCCAIACSCGSRTDRPVSAGRIGNRPEDLIRQRDVQHLRRAIVRLPAGIEK